MVPVSRRETTICLGVATASAWFGLAALAIAQTGPRQVRVGLIEWGNSELSRESMRTLLDGLRERGYVEGKNLVFERRHAEGHSERMPAIANELLGLRLDVIVTTCTPSTRLMHSLTQSTPLVMAAVSDPIGQRLIDSYSRPGGNITGLASQFEDIAAKMLGLFREAVPRLSHVAVVFNAGNPVHKHFLREMAAAAPPMNLRLSPTAVGGATDIAATFDAMASSGITGVLVLPDDPLLTNRRRQFAEQAARHGMASFFGMSEAVDDGGLMSYGENFRQTYFRAAHYVDKILNGASPAQIPVEQPTRFELAVNQKTARMLGLAIPRSILLRADKVIE